MALVGAGTVGGICLCGLAAWPKLKRTLLNGISSLVAKALGGVPVTLGNLNLSIKERKLQVIIHHLTIGNVEGFQSEFLTQIKELTVAIDLGKALGSAVGSCGKPSEIEIVLVKASECNFTYEKDSVLSSNFKALIDKLGKEEKEEEKEEQGEGNRPSGLQLLSSAASGVHGTVKSTAIAVHSTETTGGKGLKILNPFRKTEEKKPGGMEILLHEIDITGIDVEVVTSSQKEGGKAGQHMKIANIKFDDFSKECGPASAPKAVRILIMKIMQALLTGCTNLASVGHKAFEGLEEATQSTWSYMTSWLTG